MPSLLPLIFLLFVFPAQAQYSQDCVSGPDNATVFVPADVDKRLPSSRQLSRGDAIAARTDTGVCVGYVSIPDTIKTAFAVKGYDPYSEVGFKAGEEISYEVLDVSQGDTLQIDPVYRTCEGLAICKDTKGLQSGALYKLDALSRTASPIELAQFTVRADGTQVEMRWTTTSETNNTGFEVQRKRKSWSTLGFVEGAGTTSEPQEYRYSVDMEPGTYSFRLKQVDQDGTSTFSEVRQLEILPSERNISETAPNPARNEARVNVKLPSEQVVRAYVVNLLGQRVATLAPRSIKGRETIEIDASNLSSGPYFLILEGDGWQTNRNFKVVK